jgi:hypothetical protein
VPEQHIEIPFDEGQMVLGYIACFKVIRADGTPFWALRTTGINDMEALGMAHDMVNSIQADLMSAKVVRDE